MKTIFDKVKNISNNLSYEDLIKKYHNMIRERAITATKARLAEQHLKIEDFTDEELETIIAEEEQKIKDKIKIGGISAIALLFGLSF